VRAVSSRQLRMVLAEKATAVYVARDIEGNRVVVIECSGKKGLILVAVLWLP
jgi:hypothetical protein